jgi:hypothetical protein
MVITALDITLLVWGKSLWGLAWPVAWKLFCAQPDEQAESAVHISNHTQRAGGEHFHFFLKECFLPTIPLDFSGTSECQKVCTYSLLFREQLIELPRFGSTAVYL